MIGKVGGHVRLLSQFKKKRKRKGHLHGLRARGGAGSAESRMLLHFDETPEAEEAQIQACDEQHITLPGDESQAA